MTKRLSSDIDKFHEALASHKSLLMDEIAKLNEEFGRSNAMYKSFVSETEEKAVTSLSRV
jgi:hypothetical protein